MSVLVETSLGDIVIDLHLTHAPLASQNFLKQCKLRMYDGNLFFRVVPGFLAQTGDPSGTGTGGRSVLQQGVQFFPDELAPRHVNHRTRGTVGMTQTHGGQHQNGSQWYVTLRDGLGDQLDDKFTVFGNVVEDEKGVVAALNATHVDEKKRPYQDVRVLCTHILEDPFPDPKDLPSPLPPMSFVGCPPKTEQINPRDPMGKFRRKEEVQKIEDERNSTDVAAKIAKGSARTLEIIGDLPDADARPPENVLFICKMNKVTSSEALELIFSRFGEIRSCNVVCDSRTGASLQYAFIEFIEQASCEEAYIKMNNVLIDDRRIKVDFSQSLAKEWNKWSGQWQQYKRGGVRGGSSATAAVTAAATAAAAAAARKTTPAMSITDSSSASGDIGSGGGAHRRRHHHHHRSSSNRNQREDDDDASKKHRRRHHHHHSSSSRSRKDVGNGDDDAKIHRHQHRKRRDRDSEKRRDHSRHRDDRERDHRDRDSSRKDSNAKRSRHH